MAAPAGAASVAEFHGLADGEGGTVHGTLDGDDETLDAGLFDLTIDGTVESKAYCIDINTPIEPGADLDEIDWATSGVNNLETVEAILRHYYPNGDGPADHLITGTNAQKAMATQAAIWHFTDGFDLTEADNDATVYANYLAILAAVDAGLEGFGEPEVTLTITPPESTEGTAGVAVGPYVVNTSAASVTLTPSEGVSLVDENGEPFTGTVTDGTQVWLTSGAAGTGTITATAEAEVGAGRVFFTQGQQRLVLASTVVTDAAAEAAVSFQTPPTTPTPTTSSTTSTTVPITPQTSVVTDTPTTTVPIVPTANTGGGLPNTGAPTMILLGVALVLVVVGAGFGIVSRRKRLES